MNPKFLALIGVSGVSLSSELLALDIPHEERRPQPQQSEIVLENFALDSFGNSCCGNSGCTCNGGCGNNGGC
jgi:hypothetical protein